MCETTVIRMGISYGQYIREEVGTAGEDDQLEAVKREADKSCQSLNVWADKSTQGISNEISLMDTICVVRTGMPLTRCQCANERIRNTVPAWERRAMRPQAIGELLTRNLKACASE